MVKIKISTYVKTLEALLVNATPAQVKSNFADFLRLLKKNRQLAQLPKILDSLAKKLRMRNGKLEARVEYAGAAPRAVELKQIENFLQERFAAKKIDLQLSKNDQLDAGFLIETEERQFNLALNNQLERLRVHLLAN